MSEVRNAQDCAALEAARDALSAHAEHLRDLAKTEQNPFTQLALQDAAVRADKAAAGYAATAKTPPVLPPEPPVGTVCRGSHEELWQRVADVDGESRWCRDELLYRFGDALDEGLDPSRRLIELPDPDDEAAMCTLEIRADQKAVNFGRANSYPAEYYVRALSEQGAPDAD